MALRDTDRRFREQHEIGADLNCPHHYDGDNGWKCKFCGQPPDTALTPCDVCGAPTDPNADACSQCG